MNEGKRISIDTSTFIRLAFVALIVWLLYLLIDFVVIIILSLIFATAIRPGRQFLERLKIPSSISVIIIYLFILVVFGLLTYSTFPLLAEQSLRVANQLGSLIDTFNDFLLNTPFSTYIESIDLTVFSEQLLNGTKTFFGSFSEGASKIIGGIINFVLFLLLSFFFSVKEKGVTDFIKTISPIKYRTYVLDLWARSKAKIGRWVQGQLLLALIIGVLVFIGLTIIGIPNALFLAVFAAVFELIPLIGPVVSAIPAILVALSEVGFSSVIFVIILFVLIQQFENHLIYPLVVTKVVGIPTVVVILAIVIGAKLLGFIGIIVAIPIAAILLEFFKDLQLGRINDFIEDIGNKHTQDT